MEQVTGHMAAGEILPFTVMKFPRQFVAPTDTSFLTTIHQSTPCKCLTFMICQGFYSAIKNMFSPHSLKRREEACRHSQHQLHTKICWIYSMGWGETEEEKWSWACAAILSCPDPTQQGEGLVTSGWFLGVSIAYCMHRTPGGKQTRDFTGTRVQLSGSQEMWECQHNNIMHSLPATENHIFWPCGTT